MNKHKIISLLIPVFIYLAFAFIAADMNPFNWLPEGRFAYVVISTVFACPVYFFPSYEDC